MDPVHFRAVGVRVSAALGAKTIMFVAAWSRVLTFWQLVALLSSQTVEQREKVCEKAGVYRQVERENYYKTVAVGDDGPIPMGREYTTLFSFGR